MPNWSREWTPRCKPWHRKAPMFDNDSETQPRAPDTVEVLRKCLSSDLRTAMKARDKTVIETLRCLLAVLDNAGAPDQTSAPVPVFGRSGDVPRRSLTRNDLQELLRAEVTSRSAAVALSHAPFRQVPFHGER
jgi:hypothetical protein